MAREKSASMFALRQKVCCRPDARTNQYGTNLKHHQEYFILIYGSKELQSRRLVAKSVAFHTKSADIGWFMGKNKSVWPMATDAIDSLWSIFCLSLNRFEILIWISLFPLLSNQQSIECKCGKCVSLSVCLELWPHKDDHASVDRCRQSLGSR